MPASPPTPSRATSSQIHVIPLACCCVVCTTQRTLTYATRIVTMLENSWHCEQLAHTAASHSSIVQVHLGGNHRSSAHAPDAKESISQRRAQVKRLTGQYPHPKSLVTVTHDHWLGAVGTVSLAWRLTSRYDSPTKMIARSCTECAMISHLLAEGEDWACQRTHRPPRRLLLPHTHQIHQAQPVPNDQAWHAL